MVHKPTTHLLSKRLSNQGLESDVEVYPAGSYTAHEGISESGYPALEFPKENKELYRTIESKVVPDGFGLIWASEDYQMVIPVTEEYYNNFPDSKKDNVV